MLDAAFDANLTALRFPVEQQRGARVGRQLLALAALLVGVEHETPFVGAFQQNDARRWRAVRRGGRQGHGVGVFRLMCPRLGHPLVESGEWIGHERAAVWHGLVFPAERAHCAATKSARQGAIGR
jgi:hypothetical protein